MAMAVPDQAYLVSISAGSAKGGIAPDVTVVSDLWTDGPLGAHAEKIAIAIVLGQEQAQIPDHQLFSTPSGNAGFFDSPSWEQGDPPISVAKRGSAPFKDFQKQEKTIKNDVLVLGTEAGIDTALYWNGKTFVVFAPNEEP